SEVADDQCRTVGSDVDATERRRAGDIERREQRIRCGVVAADRTRARREIQRVVHGIEDQTADISSGIDERARSVARFEPLHLWMKATSRAGVRGSHDKLRTTNHRLVTCYSSRFFARLQSFTATSSRTAA